MDSLELYRRVYLVRRAEQTVQARYPENEMKTPVHLSIGQEAVAVGVVAALEPGDRIYATYRSHAVFLARTLDVDGFFAELYGRDAGIARGKAGSMHLAAPAHGFMTSSAVVGTTIPLALGAALAARYRKSGGRACAFFGDGAIDEGVFWESLNFASARRLPVLFVCEDNGLAIHARAEQRHGYDSIADVVARYRCAVFRSESTDAAELRDLAREALERIDRDGAPAFLHLRCYRFVEHVGIEEDRRFDLPYRDRAEFEHWQRKDPVAVLRRRVEAEGAAPERIAALERAIDASVAAAVERARAGRFPPPEVVAEDVFA